MDNGAVLNVFNKWLTKDKQEVELVKWKNLLLKGDLFQSLYIYWINFLIIRKIYFMHKVYAIIWIKIVLYFKINILSVNAKIY